MKTFNSLDHVKRFEHVQVSAQELLNGQMYLKDKGWDDIRLKPELKEEICRQLTETIGGHKRTKEIVFSTLMHERPQHWALERFFVVQYGKKPARLTYCAGQDMTWEMKQLREYLKK